MRDLPRKLSVEQLAALFEGRTRFVERLAGLEHPLEQARTLASSLPEDEQVEALAAHPAIGAASLSARSAAEQGADVVPEFAALNRAYEDRFGFRFVVFVAGRSKRELVPVIERRLARTRAQELATGLAELVAIAEDRWRRS